MGLVTAISMQVLFSTCSACALMSEQRPLVHAHLLPDHWISPRPRLGDSSSASSRDSWQVTLDFLHCVATVMQASVHRGEIIGEHVAIGPNPS